MYMYTQGHSRLISTGIFVPEQRVSSRDLMAELDSLNRFGVPHDWLERAMGIRERRVAPDGTCPSEMAALSANEAMERAGVLPTEIDVIIYTGVDRDHLEPATAHNVQQKIGARNAICFDVTNACHGFMNGIHLVDALIATGQAKRALVVTGEQASRATRLAVETLKKSHDKNEFIRLAGGLSLGDAGAAMILGPKLGPDSGFQGFMLQSQGQFADLCVCGTRGAETTLKTDMPAIVREHIQLHANMYDHFMAKLRWQPADVKWFVHHQVGLRAFRMHANYAKVSLDIMSNTVATMGNLVSATIPVNIHNLMINNKLSMGQKIFVAGAGSGLSISQAGLIWDAA